MCLCSSTEFSVAVTMTMVGKEVTMAVVLTRLSQISDVATLQ